eukprot:143630-Rhodomonas_salina.2
MGDDRDSDDEGGAPPAPTPPSEVTEITFVQVSYSLSRITVAGALSSLPLSSRSRSLLALARNLSVTLS